MSRITEKMLQEKVDTLAERYPQADLRLQWRGVGWGVWSAKYGKWLIEGMASNSDLADAIGGVWSFAVLERDHVRRDLLARLRQIKADSETALGQGEDPVQLYAVLLADLNTLIADQAQLLPS